MSNRRYFVSIPIEGRIEVEVTAATEEEAIKKAVSKASPDIDSYLDQVSFLEKESTVFDKDDFES